MTSQDPINLLKKYGIKYQKYDQKKEEYHFKCDTNPYLPEPNDEARTLLGQLGNTWTYTGSTKKLVVGKFKT